MAHNGTLASNMQEGEWKNKLKIPERDQRVQTAVRGQCAVVRNGLEVAQGHDCHVDVQDVTNIENDVEFEDYHFSRDLLAGIYEKGFERPSPIQEAAIPFAMVQRDILARAKNGTGKTAAFCIPILEMVSADKNHIQGALRPRLLASTTGTLRMQCTELHVLSTFRRVCGRVSLLTECELFLHLSDSDLGFWLLLQLLKATGFRVQH